MKTEEREMNYEWHKKAGSKFQRVSLVMRYTKDDRNERKGEFSVTCEIEKRKVKAENGLEKNDSKSTVKRSKEQEPESRKICQKFWD